MAKFKARKTPSSEYPANPPKIDKATEMVYHAIRPSAVDGFISTHRDQIVTSQIFYKPGILAIARVVFEGTRWAIYHEREVVRIVPYPQSPRVADWDQNLIQSWDNSSLRSAPEGVCFYIYTSGNDFSPQRFEALQEEYAQYLLSHETLELIYNPHLKIYKKLDEEEDQFFHRCLELIHQKHDPEMRAVEESLSRQEERLKEKLQRQVMELGSDPVHLTETGANQPVGLNNQEEMDARESIVTIEDIKKQMEEIQEQRRIKRMEFEENLMHMAQEREKDLMRAHRGDIQILRFALIWLPYTEFILQEGENRRLELVQSF